MVMGPVSSIGGIRMTDDLTSLLQSIQGLNIQSVLDAFQLLKRGVFFASLNASVVVATKPSACRNFRLGEPSLFAKFPGLLAQHLAPVILIFCSHILINIQLFERDCNV